MNLLRLSILPGCDEIYIQFFIDGENLGKLISNPPGGESKHFFDDALPYHGGDYKREHTVLGQPARSEGMTSAILFACGCGHSACSSLEADVIVTESTITLQNFHDWRGKVSDLGPITFDRAQYDAAIAELDKQAAAWTRPPPLAPRPPRPPLITPPADPGNGNDRTPGPESAEETEPRP